jgi:hypothetical protein
MIISSNVLNTDDGATVFPQKSLQLLSHLCVKFLNAGEDGIVLAGIACLLDQTQDYFSKDDR